MAHKLPAARWLAAFMLALSAGEESDMREREKGKKGSSGQQAFRWLALNHRNKMTWNSKKRFFILFLIICQTANLNCQVGLILGVKDRSEDAHQLHWQLIKSSPPENCRDLLAAWVAQIASTELNWCRFDYLWKAITGDSFCLSHSHSHQNKADYHRVCHDTC